MSEFLHSRLAPFASKAFRQFFAVQAVSSIGIWAFDLARAWIVVDGLGRAESLGLVMTAGAVPVLFLSLYAGVIVDRVDIRRLMIWTKTLLAVLSIILAYIVEFNDIQIWHLVAFGFIQGCVTSFDSPTFQALLVRVVPRQDFQQALALNSSLFHASRSLGPIVAGILMALHGPSLVFLFDGISYLGLIFILTRIDMRKVRNEDDTASQSNPLSDFFAGVHYMVCEGSLRYMILQLYATLILLFPILIVVLRTYIKERYQLSAEEFGYIFSWPAAGAMMGSLAFAIVKPEAPIKGLLLGIPISVACLLSIPLMPTALAAGVLMGFGGFFVYFCFGSLTLSMALYIEEKYRGRVASIFTLGFMAVGPLMSYPVGAIADRFGDVPTMRWLIITFAVLSVLLYLLHRKPLKLRNH